MPFLFHEPTERRNFLRVVSTAGAAAVLTGCRSTRRVQSGSTSDPGKTLHLALISDTHIAGNKADTNRGFKPWDNLKQVVGEVEAARPEGVIHCGDAARLEGKVEDYNEVKGLLSPLAAFAPVWMGLGNHDDRANFQKVFTQAPGAPAGIKNKHVLVFEEADIRFVMLDSLLYTNKTAGLLGKEQRAWLKEYLATNSEKPVIIFVHHTLEDNDGDLLDARYLFDMVAPHRHVKAIFYGHSHVWELSQHNHVKLINLPAVGYNFRDKDPVGWVDARFDQNGVDLTLRALGGNRTEDRKITRVDWVA